MNFSFALTNLLLSVSLTLSKADGPADWVRTKLEENIALNGMGGTYMKLRSRQHQYHSRALDFMSLIQSNSCV